MFLFKSYITIINIAKHFIYLNFKYNPQGGSPFIKFPKNFDEMKIRQLISLFIVLSICAISGCKKESDKNNCTLEPDPGNCKAAIPKYYYDQGEKICKEFIWGGCGGTVPFDSMKECKACVRSN